MRPINRIAQRRTNIAGRYRKYLIVLLEAMLSFATDAVMLGTSIHILVSKPVVVSVVYYVAAQATMLVSVRHMRDRAGVILRVYAEGARLNSFQVLHIERLIDASCSLRAPFALWLSILISIADDLLGTARSSAIDRRWLVEDPRFDDLVIRLVLCVLGTNIAAAVISLMLMAIAVTVSAMSGAGRRGRNLVSIESCVLRGL